MNSAKTEDKYSAKNILYFSIPIIQRVLSFTPGKKLSRPLRLAEVCTTWNETVHDYSGGAVIWHNEFQKQTKKSEERLVAFFHKACMAQPCDVTLWIVEQFLQMGIVDPSAADRAGFQPIHFSARWGNIRIMDALLFNHIINKDVCEKYKYAPVDLYALTTKSKSSVLELALETFQKDLIEHLIKRRNYKYFVGLNTDTLEPYAPREASNLDVRCGMLQCFETRRAGIFPHALKCFVEKWESIDLQTNPKKGCFEPIFDPNGVGETFKTERSKSFSFFDNDDDHDNDMKRFQSNDIVNEREQSSGIVCKYDTGEFMRNLKQKYNGEFKLNVFFQEPQNGRTLFMILCARDIDTATTVAREFPDRCDPMERNWFDGTNSLLFRLQAGGSFQAPLINPKDPDMSTLIHCAASGTGATPIRNSTDKDMYQKHTDFWKLLLRLGNHFFEKRKAEGTLDKHQTTYPPATSFIEERLAPVPPTSPGAPVNPAVPGMSLSNQGCTAFLFLCASQQDNYFMPNHLKFFVDVMGSNPRARIPFDPKVDDAFPANNSTFDLTTDKGREDYQFQLISFWYNCGARPGHGALDLLLSNFGKHRRQDWFMANVTRLVELGVDPEERHPAHKKTFVECCEYFFAHHLKDLQEHQSRRYTMNRSQYFGYVEPLTDEDKAEEARRRKQMMSYRPAYEQQQDLEFLKFVGNVKRAITTGYQFRKENGDE